MVDLNDILKVKFDQNSLLDTVNKNFRRCYKHVSLPDIITVKWTEDFEKVKIFKRWL